MNKRISFSTGFSTITLLVSLGAAVFLGVGVFILSKTSAISPTFHAKNTAPDNLTNRELNTTIPDIISQGQSLECDWQLPADGSDNPFDKGKLWTTGNKGRSTIAASVNGMAMEANAIYLNNTAYSWMIIGGQKIGMKFSESDLQETGNSMTPQERQQAEQIRQSMLFNCQPWKPDETKFILPSDVEFRET